MSEYINVEKYFIPYKDDFNADYIFQEHLTDYLLKEILEANEHLKRKNKKLARISERLLKVSYLDCATTRILKNDIQRIIEEK